MEKRGEDKTLGWYPALQEVHPGQRRMLKTGKNRKGTGKMEGGEIPLGDEPLPSLTSPEERKKIVATCLALCWVLFIIILSFHSPKYAKKDITLRL